MAMAKPMFWPSAMIAVLMPDHLAGRVDQRPARVAGVDGGVGLHEVVEVDVSPPTPGVLDAAVLGRDDALGHRGLTAQVERVADGDHRLAHLDGVRGPELGGDQVVDAVDPDDRQVLAGRAADQAGGVARAVEQADVDLVGRRRSRGRW